MKRLIELWKHTKIKIVLVFLCMLAILCWNMISSIRFYRTLNPTPFEAIVDYFTENPSERPFSIPKNVLVFGWNDISGSEILPQEIKAAMESILRWSNCTEIRIEMWNGELDYCSFSHFGKKVESGIAFLPTPDKEKELFDMLMRRQCVSITDNWVYYEVYTPLGEKDFPY